MRATHPCFGPLVEARHPILAESGAHEPYPYGYHISRIFPDSHLQTENSQFSILCTVSIFGVDDFGKSYYGQLLENAWYKPPTA